MADDTRPQWTGADGNSFPKLLTITQLGEYLGHGWDWADAWVKSQGCPIEVRLIGRTRYVSKADVDAWLAPKATV